MPRFRHGLVTFATLLAACSGSPNAVPSLVATPAPPPAATTVATAAPTLEVPGPTAAETPSTFMSLLYDYSITLPAGWHAGSAMLRWDGASAPGDDDPSVDKFAGPGTVSAFANAGPTSDDLDTFVRHTIEWTVRDHGDTCPATAPEVTEPIDFGGEKGHFLAWNCGILINQALLVRDGVAYTMVMRDPGVPAATDAADRALLQQLLDSVVFGS